MSIFSSSVIPVKVLDGFRSAGFVDGLTEYDEPILTKSMPCGEMPVVVVTVVDGICITTDTLCIINLTEMGVLQLLIEGDDFEERYNFLTNHKGFCENAMDAGVKQEFLL